MSGMQCTPVWNDVLLSGCILFCFLFSLRCYNICCVLAFFVLNTRYYSSNDDMETMPGYQHVILVSNHVQWITSVRNA
uniref:Uncharacterized protein n=1 Tax=Rhizophora mucronata TaxID=61149 RepID=A0A2P2IZB6_RHIMU